MFARQLTFYPVYNSADSMPRHDTIWGWYIVQSCAQYYPEHRILSMLTVPVRDLLLYAGTWQSVLGPGSVLRLSHAPLTSGLWGSQLLKQRKAHYSHCSLQSATVSHPSLGRYTQLLPCFLFPPHPPLPLTNQGDTQINRFVLFCSTVLPYSKDQCTINTSAAKQTL